MDDQRFLDWERALAVEKSAKSRGSANIKLEVLYFQRDSDDRNTRRLTTLFRKGGHHRLDSHNHVLAVIDAQSLESALRDSGLSADMLLDNSQGSYRDLNFPPGFRLRCLHGVDRVQAAAQSLPPRDRRWVVDLFVEGDIFLWVCCIEMVDSGHRYQSRPGDGSHRAVRLRKSA
jgi:hypothetical protein